MPDVKEIEESLMGFSLADKVEELRGKYQLKKKDSESYRENSQVECVANDKIIELMRQNNRIRRIILAEDENGDERVIKSVFDDNREDRLSLQRYTATGAINEMDQRACEAAKALNNMKYEREKREKKLEDLKQQLEQLHEFENMSPEQKKSSQNVTQLENSLDKALIKYDTARIISQRYREILDRLKEESLTLPARLDTMEQTLIQQSEELRELKTMCRQAVTARDEAKLQAQQVEQESYEARRHRESELVALKKQVEKLQKGDTERMAEKDKKSFRASLLMDQQDHKANEEAKQQLERQHQILAFDSAMQRIKQATHVSDLEGVVDRVMSQGGINLRLQIRVAEIETTRKKLRDDLAKLRKTYHDMKFSGDLKLTKGRRLLEQSESYLDNEKESLTKAQEALERNGKLLADMKVGITTLGENLADIKLKPPQFSYTTSGDVFDEMGLCMNKVTQLMKDVAELNEGPVAVSTDVKQPEFHEFLEAQLPADNMRVRVQKSSSGLSEFDFDGQENDVMSRNDVKNQSQKLIDSRGKKTKRRKPKKKQ